jgi:hypothetical protein
MAADDAKAAKQRGVIYALAPSFKDQNTLWAGTDDGLFWITRDGGKNWANITSPEIIPWSKVTQMTASHFDEQSAYASVSRFRIDDLHPYIYRTHDGGKTWQVITHGLPDNAPVDTVREDPVRKGLLFAGTENSVWVSFDDGDHWQSLQLNLPHTSMRDLWIHDDDLIVATHGRSFWILDDISPLRQIDQSTTSANAFLFKSAAAYRVKRSTNPDTPIPPDEPSGENPPDGAIIDYFLSSSAHGPVILEVFNGRGDLVRRYADTDKPERTPEQLQKQLIPLYWVRPFRALSAHAGMHRWIWDLHYSAPDSIKHEYPIAAVPHETPRVPLGPPAVPGEYKVKLTAAGRTLMAPLIVKMDPRVKASAADLQQQFQTESSLVSMITKSTHAILEARSLHEQLDQLSAAPNDSLVTSSKDLDKKVSAVLTGPSGDEGPAPSLAAVNSSATALYAEIDRADAAPTSAQVDAVAKLEKDLVTVTKRWDELKSQDLPGLNMRVRGANRPEIHLEPHTESDEGEGQDID